MTQAAASRTNPVFNDRKLKSALPRPTSCCRSTSGALASLAAAVAGGWGDKDLAEVPQFFRKYMLQDYE